MSELARIKSGIEGLDSMLDGGIPEHNQTIIAGGPGAGKTLLSFEILYHNAKAGIPGVFIALEEKPEVLLSNVKQAFKEFKDIDNPNQLDNIKLFGYTKLDSLRIILEMQPADYPKLFGSTTERVFIFQNVSTGRSPLVVIRVAPIKPRIVVIHNLTNIDKLAVKIAQIEKIPLLTSKLSMEEIEARLSKV